MSIEANPYQEQVPQTLRQEVLVEKSQELIKKVKDAFAIEPGIAQASFAFSPLNNEYWSLTLVNSNRFHIEKRTPLFGQDGKPIINSALALDITVYEGGFSVWDMTKKYEGVKNTKDALDRANNAVNKIIGLRSQTDIT